MAAERDDVAAVAGGRRGSTLREHLEVVGRRRRERRLPRPTVSQAPRALSQRRGDGASCTSRDAAIVDKLGAMTDRMRRVNESVRQVLSEALLELKDPRIGFVTVTGVETSPDLRQATVFVSVLGTARKQDRTMAGLERRARRAPGPASRGSSG